MNGRNFPYRPTEIIITLLINLVVGITIYSLTLSVFKTSITLLITVPSLIVAYILYRKITLLKDSGFTRKHKDSPDPTPMLSQYFKSSKRIRLLAIRGARMLVTDRSLINYIIRELPKRWDGNIQVLLLNPDSIYLKQRAKELCYKPKQFAGECRSAIQNIFRLKQKYSVNIEVHLYDRKPILRTIIFDDRALLSYYIGKQGHIPIQYEIKSGENSLLRMINLIYDDLWKESRLVKEDMQKGS